MGGSKESYSYSTNTVNEPDKVKVAEIEAKKVIFVEKLKGENIELRKNATIELMETNARLEQLIIKAKVEGFSTVQNKLLEMTRELNKLGEQRILMLETASGETLKTMNQHYLNFNNQINDDTTDFLSKDVPKMLGQLEKFDKNSSTFKMYHDQLDKHITNFIDNQNKYIQHITAQQQTMFESNTKLREDIVAHTNRLVENRIKHLEIEIESSTKELEQSKNKTLKQIEGTKQTAELIEGGIDEGEK